MKLNAIQTNENVFPYMETLCGKLVKYEIGTSIAYIVIMLILSIAYSHFILNVGWKKWKQTMDKYDFEFASIMMITFGIITYLISTIVICTQIFDIIKCMTFPEMYVFEYVQIVLRSVK